MCVSLLDNIACMRDETQGTDVGCEAAIIPHCRDATQLIVALHEREESIEMDMAHVRLEIGRAHAEQDKGCQATEDLDSRINCHCVKMGTRYELVK